MTDKTVEEFQRLLADIQQEAYQKGWNDAVKSILAAAQQAAPPTAEIPAPAAKMSATPPSPYPEIPIIDMVDEIVHEKPGLRGNEVVREILNRNPSIPQEVADRTGRTSLSRLEKRDHKIVNVNKRWYPADHPAAQNKQKEPATATLALSEPGE